MAKGSKNNPEARGKSTELRKFNGKSVKPVRFIQKGVGSYMAAAFENGDLAIDAKTKLPVAYKNV